MPGLSAKVFRTYNASQILKNQLYQINEGIRDDQKIQDDEQSDDDEEKKKKKKQIPDKYKSTDNEKILYYNQANRAVAIIVIINVLYLNHLIHKWIYYIIKLKI